MNKNRERKQLLAPIKNINRVLLISIVLFFIVGIVAGAAIPYITISKKLSICLLEITSYMALGLPIIIFSRLNLNGSKDVMLPKFNLKTLRNGAVCAIIAYPLMLTATYFAKTTELRSEMTSEQITSSLAGFSFLGNVIRMALLPAVVEELVFRCGLLGIYSKKNVLVGIFLSSSIFALLHGNLYQIPYAFVGGIAFAYATYITGNSGTAIVSHFIINLVSIITSYANGIFNKYYLEKTDLIEGVVTGLWMAVGVLVSGYLLTKVLKKQVIPRSLRLKEYNLELSSFVTVSLAFVISILLFLTFLYEGYMSITA